MRVSERQCRLIKWGMRNVIMTGRMTGQRLLVFNIYRIKSVLQNGKSMVLYVLWEVREESYLMLGI